MQTSARFGPNSGFSYAPPGFKNIKLTSNKVGIAYGGFGSKGRWVYRPTWATRTVCRAGTCRPCDGDVKNPDQDGCFVLGARSRTSYSLRTEADSTMTEAHYKVPHPVLRPLSKPRSPTLILIRAASCRSVAISKC